MLSKTIFKDLLWRLVLVLILSLPVLIWHLQVSKSQNSKGLSSHGFNILQNIFGINSFFLSIDKSSITMNNNNFWSTLHVNSDEFWLIWVSYNSQRSLFNWGEWTDSFDVSKLLLDQKMDWDFSILQEFKKPRRMMYVACLAAWQRYHHEKTS